MNQAHDAWSAALPAVLQLVTGHRRDLFRHELQRFLAVSRMQPAEAEALSDPLRALLLQAARAARQPGAIEATRSLAQTVPALVGLAEHLLSQWRSAEAAAQSLEEPAPDPADGMSGPTFFGRRLGGEGRPGALARADLGLDD